MYLFIYFQLIITLGDSKPNFLLHSSTDIDIQIGFNTNKYKLCQPLQFIQSIVR